MNGRLLLMILFLFSQITAKEEIDVVIPFHKKDLKTLDLCIEGIKRNCKQVRRIFVISKRRYTQNAEWVDEAIFPFSKSSVAKELLQGSEEDLSCYLESKNCRAGWYLQQLFKLYAPLVIDGIGTDVLMLDADTIFLNKVCFINKAGQALYNSGVEERESYFEQIKILTGGKIGKIFPNRSGICHHMLFQKKVILSLFNEVEALHSLPFWIAFCRAVPKQELYFSGASEYELYFNYLFATRASQAVLRSLRWANTRHLNRIKWYKKQGYHYISCHDWLRP